MHLLHGGVGVALLHPMVQHGFQVRRCDVPHNFVPNQREHLVLSGAFQPVVCGTLHRGEFENLEPVCEALLYGFLRFVRAADFLVELGDVGGNLLLGLRFGFAGEHFAAFDSLLVKVPDDALPSSVCSTKDVAVGGESFLWHGAAPFLNHQHYLRGCGNVHPQFSNPAEKNLPVFWLFYTYLGGGDFFRSILCLATQFLMWGVLLNAEKKQGRFSLPNVTFLPW